MISCKVDSCVNRLKCRGYCSTHYKQLLKHGMIVRQNAIKHNLSHSREYRSWGQMKARCLNKNHMRYKDYGGRGITICDRWINSFIAFYEDMGKRPMNTSLDRIDVNGNYEPTNCRWATENQQAVNRSNCNPIPGVQKEKYGWRATFTFNGKKLLNKRFIEFEDAVKARKQAELQWVGHPIY